MNKDNNKSSLGFLEVLQIAFIIMKVAKVIDWSWWLVFIPTYTGLFLAAIIVLITMLIKNKVRR